MPDLNSGETTPQSSLTAPVTNEEIPQKSSLTDEDISKMSEADLDKALKQVGEEVSAAPTRGPDGKFVKATPTQTTTNALDTSAAPAATDSWISLEIGPGDVLKFKSQEEVQKSLINAQKLLRANKQQIDKYNTERGELGGLQKQVVDSNTKIQELSQYIAQLQKGAGSVVQGQTPNLTTQGALSALTRQPGQNPVELIYNEINSLKQQLEEERSARSEITAQMEDAVNSWKSKEAEVVFNNGVSTLYNDVSSFFSRHPQYKTTNDFQKVDDIVSTYGQEAAATMVDAEDLQKFNAMMEVVYMLKSDPAGEPGNIDLGRKNYQDLEEAFVILQHRNGGSAQALADATTMGQKQFETALNRAQNSARTLPNSVTNGQAAMGAEEIESLLQMDHRLIAADPELKKKFDIAERIITGQPG